MELDYLNVILDAKKEDYNKQSNLKKFYKETLTEDEFKTFEKVLKEKKSEITELESIVKKMDQYSNQYEYERIKAMSETEFDSIREEEIENKLEEIRKHNNEINDKNNTISKENDELNDEIILLKRELEEMTNEIAETGKYSKDSVKRAKEIKETIQKDKERIESNEELIEDNDKDIIVSEEISLDFESYKKQKLEELPKNSYMVNIPEVTIIDELLCKAQKKGRTPSEIEEYINTFKNDYVGGYEKEGFEYFDPVYRKDFGAEDESSDSVASKTTELLNKYFEVVEKGEKCDENKGIIERKMLVKYNTNKKHNISEITKEKLLKELIEGKPIFDTIKENNVLDKGCFLNLQDRIAIQKERINKIKKWKQDNNDIGTLMKVADIIERYLVITQNRKIEEENKEEIEKIYKDLKKYFERISFENKDAREFLSLYDELTSSCKQLKNYYSEKEKETSKKLVVNKKEHNKSIVSIDEQIFDEKELIKNIRKKIKEVLKKVHEYSQDLIGEPEKIVYPEISKTDDIENIFNLLHRKDDSKMFSLADEEDYLDSLIDDLNRAEIYYERYKNNKENNRNASIAYLFANLGLATISESMVESLLEEKNKKDPIKSGDISKRINEARVNLYLREQKEKALNDASKAKAKILGGVVNHLDLEETKTDIFASI